MVSFPVELTAVSKLSALRDDIFGDHFFPSEIGLGTPSKKPAIEAPWNTKKHDFGVFSGHMVFQIFPPKPWWKSRSSKSMVGSDDISKKWGLSLGLFSGSVSGFKSHWKKLAKSLQILHRLYPICWCVLLFHPLLFEGLMKGKHWAKIKCTLIFQIALFTLQFDLSKYHSKVAI